MKHTRNPNLDLASLQAIIDLPADDELVGPRPAWWWTGCRPVPGECPGVGKDGAITALPLPNLATCTRDEVRDYFENTWATTEVLLSSVQGTPAMLAATYHQLRHPMVFYLCHPAVLYVNKLRLSGAHDQSLDAYFEQLFETGVDEMSWDDLSKNEMTWPPVRDVVEYRRRAHALVREIIDTSPALADGHPPITQSDPLWALFLGFEHERIHIETSSVLLRELPLAVLRRPEAWPADHPSATAQHAETPLKNDLVAVPHGSVRLGKPQDWPSFGWDNEYGSRTDDVPSFEASRFLVTNREFHEFVADGGYAAEEHWTDDGWAWRRSRNAKWPTFWIGDGPQGLHQYRLRTVFDAVDMPWDWPVDVNWYEARAYCAWRTARDGSERPYRLLTEREHQRVRGPALSTGTALPEREPVMTTSGRDMAAEHGVNLNLAFGSSSPVNAFAANDLGFHDSVGNVWQWCEDDFNPLPGFEVHPVYDDFSAPCFDGEHKMILGGSFASSGDEASIWSRFHFRPHFHQHAGFRLARSVDGPDDGEPVLVERGSGGQSYETDAVLGQYLQLHFGGAEDAMPWEMGPREAALFPQRVADWAATFATELGAPQERAIDIGSAVGGTSFSLARHYREVLGVDLSDAFISTAQRIQGGAAVPYALPLEGDLCEMREARAPEGVELSRVSFRRADACGLPPELEGFDLAVLANLLCRLPSPRACLGRLGGARGIVKPGGLLAITTPFTWLEAHTPRGAWLGGQEIDGREVRSMEALRAALDRDFELIDERPMPLVIRETVRKFQYIVSHGSLWRRRAL